MDLGFEADAASETRRRRWRRWWWLRRSRCFRRAAGNVHGKADCRRQELQPTARRRDGSQGEVSKDNPVKALTILKPINQLARWVSFAGRQGFRAGVLLFSFWLTASSASAAPCSQTNSQREAWVSQKVDALIRAARALYENDKAQKAYERMVDDISATMKRCRMAEDGAFVARYPEFVEYVQARSIAQLSDHELGFIVPDKVYFAETSKYVAIPDFLLTPRFLRAVSRFETLKQAKALLRKMNAGRAADDQLLFFSYKSRHLGTPDNPDSFRRLLIVVPGNTAQHVPEKWVQFGVPDPRARVGTVRNVSVVAAVPGADQTTNVYFKDYFRTYRRG